MKTLKYTFMALLAAALFFTACQEEEIPEIFDSISGVLSAGENVSADDLNTITIRLGLLNKDFDLSTDIIEIEEIELIDTTRLNTDGSFSFKNLENGNYVLGLGRDFIFERDSFIFVTIDNQIQNVINEVALRLTPENWWIDLDKTPSRLTLLDTYSESIDPNTGEITPGHASRGKGISVINKLDPSYNPKVKFYFCEQYDVNYHPNNIRYELIIPPSNRNGILNILHYGKCEGWLWFEQSCRSMDLIIDLENHKQEKLFDLWAQDRSLKEVIINTDNGDQIKVKFNRHWNTNMPQLIIKKMLIAQ